MCCHRKPREEKAWDGQEVEDYPQKESASKHPYFLNPTTGRVEHSLATCWTSQDYTQIPGWCKFEISHCKHPPKLYQLHPILPHPLVAQRALRSPRDTDRTSRCGSRHVIICVVDASVEDLGTFSSS